MRNKLYIVGSLIVGAVFVALAISDFAAGGTCDGKAMTEGATCTTTGPREYNVTTSAQEQATANAQSGWKNLGWAGLAFAAGGGLFVIERRRKRTLDNT